MLTRLQLVQSRPGIVRQGSKRPCHFSRFPALLYPEISETSAQIAAFCPLDAACDALMKNAFDRMGLTARSHDRILRVARTIADLDGDADIAAHHLAEAIQYRNTDILKG